MGGGGGGEEGRVWVRWEEREGGGERTYPKMMVAEPCFPFSAFSSFPSFPSGDSSSNKAFVEEGGKGEGRKGS